MAPCIMDTLTLEIQQIISDITGIPAGQLDPDANFWRDLDIDSIKAIEMTVAIERKYKVRVRDEQIPKITTICEAAVVVREALGKKTAA